MKRVALALLMALLGPLPARGQEAPAWTASVAWSHDAFDGSAPAWEGWDAWTAGAALRFATGAVAVEGGLVRRFDFTDSRGALELYHDLWSSAYGYARAELAPAADVIARSDLSAELFQGLPGGWEPSAAYRRMEFADATVHLASASIGRFVGPWHGRIRVGRAARSGSAAHAVAALLRRSLDDRDEAVEARFTRGGEVVTVPATGEGVEAVVRTTTSFGGAARLGVGRRGLVTIGLDRTGFEGIPTRTSATLGLSVRW